MSLMSMNSLRARAFTAALGFVFFSCAHAAREQAYPSYSSSADIPLEDFFRNPELTGYRISPDGQTLAVLKPWKTRLNVFVHPVSDPNTVKQVTFVEDRDIYEVTWKGSNHVLYAKDNGGDENDHIFLVDVRSGQTRDLTPYTGVKANLVDTLEDISSDEILISHNQRDKKVYDLYRVNVVSGASQRLVQNDFNVTSWLIDHTGAVRGGTATDGVNSVVYYEKTKGKPWQPLLSTNFRNTFTPVAFTADDRNLYVLSNLKSNLIRLVEVDPTLPKSKLVVKEIYGHPKYDISDVTYSRANRKLGPITVITDRRETVFLDPRDRKDWEGLAAHFQGRGAVVANMSLDQKYWVVKTISDLTRGTYYLYNREQRKVTKLGDVSPWLNPELMSPMATVHYKTRDGLTIEAYLTLPHGKDAKNLPVVINPHGGPWARDEWGFNAEAQFLASRGYAVLQPNFRGSTGYGRKFWEASFKQWGLKMQDDVTDGVKWLISEKIADPARVCIYGASYGGYSTLAGVTFTPDLYACAVDYVGVANLFTWIQSFPPYWKPFLEMIYVMVGHPERDKARLRATSPVFHVDKIKAPLLVAQGANDPRVPKAESDQVVEALRKRGVDVEYMVKENEGHGFHNEENRFDFYRAMEKFLAKYLGGRT
ncbi:MAG: alpha/beta hydrolase family protein [Bdellovibrionales bacterium]